MTGEGHPSPLPPAVQQFEPKEGHRHGRHPRQHHRQPGRRPRARLHQRRAGGLQLPLAVTPRVRDGNGWKDGDTSFFRITAWRDLAEHLADSLAKGDRAIVLGQLKTRSWETPEGERRSVVEVTAEEAGPSLRWATAKPQRAARSNAGSGNDDPSA